MIANKKSMNQHCSTVDSLREHSTQVDIIFSLIDKIGKHPTNNIFQLITKKILLRSTLGKRQVSFFPDNIAKSTPPRPRKARRQNLETSSQTSKANCLFKTLS